MTVMQRFYIETKIAAEDSGTIVGRAWAYGTPDRYGDEVLPGAFKGAKMPLPMLFSHDVMEPVGTWTEAEEKSDGLYLTGQLLVAEVARAREVLALIKAGAVKGISVGFNPIKFTSKPSGGRVYSRAELLETSLVVVPAHPGARVISAKSAVDAMNIVVALQRAAARIQGESKK